MGVLLVSVCVRAYFKNIGLFTFPAPLLLFPTYINLGKKDIKLHQWIQQVIQLSATCGSPLNPFLEAFLKMQILSEIKAILPVFVL